MSHSSLAFGAESESLRAKSVHPAHKPDGILPKEAPLGRRERSQESSGQATDLEIILRPFLLA